MDRGPSGHLGCTLQEFLAVLPRQVGDRTDLSFHPQQLVRKRRDVTHVDAGADDYPTRIKDFQPSRRQRPDGREDQSGVERFRRRRERVARPFGPDAARERLLFRIARRGKGEDPSTLEPGDLGDDVRRVAEAIQTDALRIARAPQRAIADQAGAETRRRVQVVVTLGQRKTKALVSDAKLGIAAIQVIAGEARADAQGLEIAATEAAGLVEVAEPGPADALAGRKPVGALT